MNRETQLGLFALVCLSTAAPVVAAAPGADDGRAEEAPSAPFFREFEARGHVGIEAPPAGEAGAVVLWGGTVWTAAGDRFSPGFVVMRGGKVDAVGPGAPPDVPGARVVDLAGGHVTPGLIDLHSHLGVYPAPSARAHEDGNEMTSPTTAGVWAEHSLWPQDPNLALVLAGGVTTMQVLPGSANLIGGRGFVSRTVPARGSRAMRVEGAPDTVKMACGENPKRVYGRRDRSPQTRMGNVRGLREAFLKAQAYRAKWDAWARKKADHEEAAAKKAGKGKARGKGKGERDGGPKPFNEPPPERDLDLETLVGVLSGEVVPQVHCYRADDMLGYLQVADEMGFRIRVFHHAVEAYKIRDVLAARGVGVATWHDWWGFKWESRDGIPENLGLVTEAGGRAILHSDSPTVAQRLNQEAARALGSARRAGLPTTEDDALRWITANPAWALGIDHLLGSLRPGLRADVVVWDGDPFSVYTRARAVYVDGVLRYEADRPGVTPDPVLGLEVSP